MFRTDSSPEPRFTDTLELDLATVEPNLAGPRRPQDRVPLHGSRAAFEIALEEWRSARRVASSAISRLENEGGGGTAVASEVAVEEGSPPTDHADTLRDGSVVIAAITSCTNTSNPAVLIAAGLLARNALARGLKSKPWVKTSLAPGSKIVTDYLAKAGLTPYLDALGFNLVGYGCTTCIGNSGPLPDDVAEKVAEDDLIVAAVLSGNRNFEGRIHPQVRANYLAGRLHGYRSHHRAVGPRPSRQRRFPQRHLADQRRDRCHHRQERDRRDVPRALRRRVSRRRSLGVD
jgi:aconitate hydratase